MYLLQFDQPFKHARHFTGWAIKLDARLAEQAAGHGARLLAVVTEHGTTGQGSRGREHQLKVQSAAARRCPLCGVTPPHQVPRLPRPDLDGLLDSTFTRSGPAISVAAPLIGYLALLVYLVRLRANRRQNASQRRQDVPGGGCRDRRTAPPGIPQPITNTEEHH